VKANTALLLHFQGRYDDALEKLAAISQANPKARLPFLTRFSHRL
jgi:hypothetical protein